MAVCAACGAENRDKAKFCKGCAQALTTAPARAVVISSEPAPDPAPASSSSAPTNFSRRTSSPSSRWTWIVGPGLLAALAVAWWLQSPQRVSLPPEQRLMDSLTAPSSTPEPTPTSSVVGLATTVTAVPTAVADQPDTLQTGGTAVPEPVRKEPKAASPANARATPAVERQSPLAQTPARAEPIGAEPQQVAGAPPNAAEPQPAPAPAASVDQRCAASANFIARDICRIRACGTPALAGDPVCVRFREMEEANRNRTNQ